MFTAVFGGFSGSVDATDLGGIDNHHNEGRISRMMDGVYHEDGGEDDDGDMRDNQ